MERRGGEGRLVLLPVVTGARRALEFRPWRQSSVMEHGPFGTMHPAPGPALAPDVILVPLVAFDLARNRLGRGGGYYDRTLAAHPDARSVGFAFEWARVDAVPVGPHDRPLNQIVTDCGSI
jgi:5-formyltetrahydrofolate cyclo-ligase